MTRYYRLLLYCLFCLCYAYIASGNTHTIDSLKQLLTQPLHDTARIEVLDRLAFSLHDKKTQEALSYSKEALRLCNLTNDEKRKWGVLYMNGIIYTYMGNYSQALFYLLQSLHLCNKTNVSIRGKTRVLNAIGASYVKLNQYDIGKKYFMQAIRMNETDSSLVANNATILANIGMIESERNNLDSGLIYFKRALGLHKTKEDAFLIYLNIGLTHLNLNQPKLALSYYQQVIPFLKDNPHRLIPYYVNMGEFYLKQMDIAKAKEYYFKAETIAKNAGMNFYLAKIYEHITTMYEQEKDFENAYNYHKKHKAIEDSSLNEHTSQKIAELQKSYEIAERDNEILLLNHKQEIAESKSSNQRLVSILLVLVLICVIAFSRTVILKQRAKYKEDKTRMELQRQQIEREKVKLLYENAEAKYEVLKSKTNPHFLFNSLTTLSSIVIEDPTASLEFIDRFSTLYRMILETGDQKLISLKEELKIASNYLYLQKMKFGDNLIVETNISCDTSRFSLPPFALQMVVENATKHNIISISHQLKIKIYNENDNIIIINNLRKKNSQFTSTFTGQNNIIERYRLMTETLPVFTETETEYIVTLPLLNFVYEDQNYISA